MRKRGVFHREVVPDAKYKSKPIAQFINTIMLKGKKSIAENIVYDALNIASEKAGKKDPLEVFQKALDNVRPAVEVKSRRVGGATYQVPIEVRSDRGVSIALRWMKTYARARKGRSFVERLAAEILDAYKGEGAAVKKKIDTHKMAEANKAFSHYRW